MRPSLGLRLGTAWLLACASLAAQAADLVVIVHPGAAPLNKEQAADVFLGRAPRAVPLNLPLGTPLRDEFYLRLTGRDAAQVRAVWSRVIFTGKGLAPKEYPDASAVKRVVAENPRAVGYIERSAVDASVKVAYDVE